MLLCDHCLQVMSKFHEIQLGSLVTNLGASGPRILGFYLHVETRLVYRDITVTVGHSNCFCPFRFPAWEYYNRILLLSSKMSITLSSIRTLRSSRLALERPSLSYSSARCFGAQSRPPLPSRQSVIETFSETSRPRPYYANHPPLRELPRPKVLSPLCLTCFLLTYLLVLLLR